MSHAIEELSMGEITSSSEFDYLWIQFYNNNGVPANTLAANGAIYYATPSQFASIVQDTRSNPAFGGIMMWDAGYSDANANNGCTYAQEAKNILLAGSPCGGSLPVSSSLSTTTAKPTKSATSTRSVSGTSPTGTVPQWGQCGGEGYIGPTQCIPPSNVWNQANSDRVANRVAVVSLWVETLNTK
ncbi:hypothetical protein TrVFT333_007968 [Trichoderma virens FT-333]|nr:hypothetical protein TrVFT333_007968 [Trichoderma virens FT-333]